MKYISLFILLLFPVLLTAGDSTVVITAKQKKLRGYRQFFYRFISTHPRLNSPLEKELLKHYLAGSGETFTISAADFELMKLLLPQAEKQQNCKKAENGYCIKQVDLNDDDYFGWGLGTITVVYDQTEQPLTFIDRYDFNKKNKGQRSGRNELLTRVFRLIAPIKARSFLVTYNAEVRMIAP
nr:hypothetical protein [uncultured Lacibacter sp.]